MKNLILTVLLIAFCNSVFLGQTGKIARRQPYKKAKTQSKVNKVKITKPSKQNVLSRIDNADYSLFAELFSGSNKNPSVIINETIPAQIKTGNEKKDDFGEVLSGKVHINYLKETITDLSSETVKDFNEKNSKSYSLEKKFPFKDEYELITRDDISRLFYEAGDLGNGWENFRKKYPKSGGYYAQFSRIGLSPDKKQAIIYFTYFCGSLCASGDFIFYVKENDKWVEKGKLNLWVS